MKYLLIVFILINTIFFSMTCKQKGDIYTVSEKIYDETPTFTATSTITPTVTPTP
jgi:hypothetical protein